ncbi:hypothetical protein GCM10011371_07840 [Novosphingobium marinum]|uniref:Cell division protein ZapA n=1 Tax=Novosphingobium marinum TaxID=1514948 RepID=A0A7Y9XU39_9SPHN|nr:cell division protein ZapA [Novosphingobium marinum]NYH94472.1 cell division protein ZapA [Novosphingobium marinum]GGC22577.1 hypothetical protein GCM10011371_07840 [Novosphingobium marinum]
MSNVTLSIGGRNYAVACAEGEEERVADLGRLIDRKLREADAVQGQSELRMLLFAALLLADEVKDEDAGAAAAEPASDHCEKLEALADRLENLAARLEGGVGAS